jgi:CAAX protease family protein
VCFAAVSLGAIWSLFHLPIYYQRPVFYLIFAVLVVALSIILTWIFNRTQGSILVMVLFHGSLNVSLNLFPAPPASLNGTLAVMAAVAWLVAGLLILRYGSGSDTFHEAFTKWFIVEYN